MKMHNERNKSVHKPVKAYADFNKDPNVKHSGCSTKSVPVSKVADKKQYKD